MAISGKLTVTPEELSQQAGQVKEAAKDLKQRFDRMKQLMKETEYYWKGEAAEEHRNAYTKNQGNIEEIVARYEEHIRDLETMAGVYQEAEITSQNLADELAASTL